jgi:hypothetical protein
MERLGRDVERELTRFGPQAGLAKIVERWRECVGEAIARNAWPARVQRDGTLLVHTGSSAWAFELTQLEPSIRERLAGLVEGRLRFVPGPLPEPDAPLSGETTLIPPPVGPDERREAASVASSIADENLRKLVARAAAASLAKARSDR